MDIEDTGEPMPGNGLPVSALLPLLVAGLVLVFAAIAVPLVLPPLPRLALLGGGAAAGLLLCALLGGLRRAGWIWAGAGLALLVALGTGAGWLAGRHYEAADRLDASTFAEIEFGADSLPALPAGAAQRGPISKSYAKAQTATLQEEHAYGDALGRLGIGPLSSPYLLERASAVLSHCAEIGKAKSLVAENGRHRAERDAALVAAVDASGGNEALRNGLRAMVAPGDAGQQAALDAEQLDATQALCELLARRTWYDASGYFGFRNPADGEAFRTITARRKKVDSDGFQLRRDRLARMTEGREAVREVLSR